jgi:molybdenum cofactor guanylyltransferase
LPSAVGEDVLNFSCIVLAGGKGTRLGSDKALERINSQTLVQRSVSTLLGLGDEIIVVTAPGKTVLGLKDYPGVRIIEDFSKGKGPLMGLYTGLSVSSSELNLVVACDMPFLNLELIKFLVTQSNGWDAVIPRTGGLIEPLHAIYRKSIKEIAADLIGSGGYSLSQLLRKIRVKYVEEKDVDRYDPGRLSFFNINFPEDLAKAREILKSQSS